MPKHVYKKGTDKQLKEVGILPSSDEWNGKSNVGHTHAISDIKNLQSKLDTIPSIKTLNTNNSSAFPVSSSEARSGSGSINLHKVSKTGKFSDLSNRGEAFLSWGGQNFAGSYGPIDSAMIADLGANRLAFMPPAGISVEYSRDSGTTWQDYGATDDQKLKLTSTGANFIIGKADSSNKATERYMLRISLHTSDGKVYTQLNKFALYVSTNGSNGSYCTIRARTQNNYLNKVDKWVVFANKQSISGWSGWNIINTSTITTFGNTASSQYGEIQFIFGCTSGSTSYVGLQIQRLMGFGGVGWTTPSNMAKYGTIYSYDYEQNVKFPKKLYVNESKEVVTTGHTTSKSKTGISVSVSASKPTFTGTAHGHTATDSGHTHKYSEVTKIDLTNPVHTHEATDSGHAHSYVKTTGATFTGTAFNITHHTYSLDYNPNTYTLKLGSATSTSSVTPAGSITLKTENATTGSGKASVTLTKVAQSTAVSKIWMIDTDSGVGKANVSVSDATAGGSVSAPTCTATVTDNGHTHTL